MDLYGVVNMDIVASRNMKEREKFQNILLGFIDHMNKQHQDILVAPICLILGDEWQFILREPSMCYDLVHEFQRMLWQHEVQAYAGIGIGNISTQIYDDPRMMDGPCFIMARRALGIAKRTIRTEVKYSKQSKVFLCVDQDFDCLELSSLRINKQAIQEVAIASEDNDFREDKFILGPLVNLFIENNEILKSTMTPKQRAMYVRYAEHKSYRKILEFNEGMGTIGGISQKINNAEYFTIQRNHEMVKSIIQTYCMIRRIHL